MPKTADQCEKIRDAMREKILNGSLHYFATKGLSGTKISDLVKHIGIGQGTIYSYFGSKEELFKAITQKIVAENEKSLDALYDTPISPKEKVVALSHSILNRIYHEAGVADSFALSIHMNMEYGIDNDFSENYANTPNAVLARIIEEGQKKGGIVNGDPALLADFYWSVVHIIALKKVYGDGNELSPSHLYRILISD